VWVSLVVRVGTPVSLGVQTVFQAGDEVLLLVEPTAEPGAAFAGGRGRRPVPEVSSRG